MSGNPDDPKGQEYKFILDQKEYPWPKPSITGAELRAVGQIPADFEIWEEIPGHEDLQIFDTTTVDLAAQHRVEKFFSVKPDATAGA